MRETNFACFIFVSICISFKFGVRGPNANTLYSLITFAVFLRIVDASLKADNWMPKGRVSTLQIGLLAARLYFILFAFLSVGNGIASATDSIHVAKSDCIIHSICLVLFTQRGEWKMNNEVLPVASSPCWVADCLVYTVRLAPWINLLICFASRTFQVTNHLYVSYSQGFVTGYSWVIKCRKYTYSNIWFFIYFLFCLTF